MKSQFLVAIAFLAILSFSGTLAAIGKYDYCGKPCTDGSSLVCAYNQQCYNWFSSRCDMKKRNCDHDDRFLEVSFATCLLGSKCRGI